MGQAWRRQLFESKETGGKAGFHPTFTDSHGAQDQLVYSQIAATTPHRSTLLLATPKPPSPAEERRRSTLVGHPLLHQASGVPPMRAV